MISPVATTPVDTQSSQSMKRRFAIVSYLPLIAAVAYVVFNVWFVSVRGNFPLNDDVFYATAVKNLLESGSFELAGCPAKCYALVYLGAAVGSVFGFSYEVLRIVSITSAIFAILALYLVAREAGSPRSIAGLIACCFSVCPLTVNLSFTFMTDLLFLAALGFYFYFMLRGIRRNSTASFVWGATCLALAIFTRQIGAIFLAANLVLMAALWMHARLNPVRFLVLIVPPLACVLTVSLLPTAPDSSASASFYLHELSYRLECLVSKPLEGWTDSLLETAKACSYLGLIFLPVLTALTIGYLRQRKHGLWFASAVISIVLFSILCTGITQGNVPLMPFSVNLLSFSELGARNIISESAPALSESSHVLLTILSMTAGLLLSSVLIWLTLYSIRRSRHAATDPRVSTLLYSVSALCSSLAFLSIQMQVQNLDRYYLLLAPPIAAVLALAWRRLRARSIWLVSASILLIFSIYSSTAQQHYMSWNRARWTAIHSLLARGIDPDTIDGGAEYRHYQGIKIQAKPDYDKHKMTFDPRLLGRFPQSQWRWWPVRGDDYLVSHQPTENYETMGKIPYWSSFLNKQCYVYMLVHRSLVSETPNNQNL